MVDRKIAPGHDAEYWPQCLKEGYIGVGWDDVGDLRRLDSEANFRTVFEKHHKYGGNFSPTRRKANELLTLTKLQAGDRIIANKGMSMVLAVGVVEEPGYEWRPNKNRGEYYHTVKVKWDLSFSRRIRQQPWRQTVSEVPYHLFMKVAGGAALSRNSVLSLRQGWDDGDASHRDGPILKFGEVLGRRRKPRRKLKEQLVFNRIPKPASLPNFTR